MKTQILFKPNPDLYQIRQWLSLINHAIERCLFYTYVKSKDIIYKKYVYHLTDPQKLQRYIFDEKHI